MRNESRRSLLYSALVMIVLLLMLFTLMIDNNRKYAESLSIAVTAIVRTNQALVAPMQTQTNRAALPSASATSSP